MKEAALQADLIYRVRLLGGLAFKLAPTTKGLPDLLVLLPDQPMRLVELKTDAGSLSPAQQALHSRINATGQVVHVLRGPDAARAWLKAQYAAADEQRFDQRRNRNAPQRRDA